MTVADTCRLTVESPTCFTENDMLMRGWSELNDETKHNMVRQLILSLTSLPLLDGLPLYHYMYCN